MTLPKLSDRAKVCAVTTSILLVVYGWTAAPFITLMDAGDLATGTLSLGIAHPPGYPLFTLLGFAAARLLWFLEPIHSLNLMNAGFGALACGVLTAIVYTLVPNRILAVFAGLSLASTSICWTLSATAEVYSLNLLLSNTLWLLAIDIRAKFTAKKWALFTVFLGLALANCYPLVLLTGLGLVLVFPKETYQVKNIVNGMGCVLVGLLPYLYLVIQSQRSDGIEYNIYGLYRLENVVPYILRTSYAALDQKSSGLWDKWEVLFLLLYNIAKDFSLTTLFVGSGIYSAFQSRMALRWPLAISAFTSSVLLYLLLGTTGQHDQFFQFYEYILPTLAVLAIFAALGIDRLLTRYGLSRRVQAGVCAIALVSQVAFSYPESNHHGNASVDAWAKAVMTSLPKNASLLLCGDEFAFMYLKSIRGIRPDIRLLVSYLDKGVLHFYQRDKIGGKAIEKRQTLDALLGNPESPVFTTECGPLYIRDGYTIALKGLTYQITSPTSPELPGTALTADALKATLDSILKGPARTDYWMKKLRLRSASLLLAYGTHEKVISPEALEDLIKHYNLDKELSFLGSLAAEFAYCRDYRLSMQFYQRLKIEDFAHIKGDEAAVYCRMLLSNGDAETAQSVCYIADKSFRECDADSKYNLGRAFWNRKEKSIQYFTEATLCNPQSQGLKDVLKKRQDAPAGVF